MTVAGCVVEEPETLLVVIDVLAGVVECEV